jgi:hypothetical protein
MLGVSFYQEKRRKLARERHQQARHIAAGAA